MQRLGQTDRLRSDIVPGDAHDDNSTKQKIAQTHEQLRPVQIGFRSQDKPRQAGGHVFRELGQLILYTLHCPGTDDLKVLGIQFRGARAYTKTWEQGIIKEKERVDPIRLFPEQTVKVIWQNISSPELSDKHQDVAWLVLTSTKCCSMAYSKGQHYVLRVQKRFTRMLLGLEGLNDKGWLDRLRFFSLEQKRLKGNFIDVYKIMEGIDMMNSKGIFPSVGEFKTRGHIFK
eukprot:g44092.t1